MLSVMERPAAEPVSFSAPLPAPPPSRCARLAVTAAGTAASEDEARALAEALGLPFVRSARSLPPGTLVLARDEEHLSLCDPHDPRRRPLIVDFSFLLARPLGGGVRRRDPLVRALGRRTRRVVDATAGLGYDAARLAAFGFEVTAIERIPAVAALLRDGLRRAERDPRLARLLFGSSGGGRLAVIAGEAREWLPALRPPPEAVYLDPMFPPKRKRTAAARKALVWLRALVGPDEDAAALLATARACAPRVVVKRPDDAPALGPEPPAFSYPGKLVRYDVYLARGG